MCTEGLNTEAFTGAVKSVDLAVFAGQSNMSGRGNAALAVPCREDAGFEYKPVSAPDMLVPIVEPFGLGEDRKGAIYDIAPNGKAKRTGSMVSAAVNEYYGRTRRKIVAVSASVGGTNTGQWLNNYIYDAAGRLDAASAFLKRNDISVGRIFVVWCQGESDGDAKTSAGQYIENLKSLFAEFKAHGAEKCFVVRTGHYNYIDYPGVRDGLTGAEWDEQYKVIRDAQTMLCESDDDFVPAGSLEPFIGDMKDAYHYNQNAYNAIGKAVGAAIAEYYSERK